MALRLISVYIVQMTTDMETAYLDEMGYDRGYARKFGIFSFIVSVIYLVNVSTSGAPFSMSKTSGDIHKTLVYKGFWPQC